MLTVSHEKRFLKTWSQLPAVATPSVTETTINLDGRLGFLNGVRSPVSTLTHTVFAIAESDQRSEAPDERNLKRMEGGASMEGQGLHSGDKLVLRGLKFHGYHGVKAEEKNLGQKFLIDMDAWLDLRQAGKIDSLANTVSYTDIYRIAKEIVEGPSQNLLESVAHLIADTTLRKFPQISAVRVTVGKPHVAVQGPIDYLGVEILRNREVDKPGSWSGSSFMI